VETIKRDFGTITRYDAKWTIEDNLIKQVIIENGEIYVSLHKYTHDSVIGSRFFLTPSDPPYADSLGYSPYFCTIGYNKDSLFEGRFFEEYYLGEYLHPCQCLAQLHAGIHPDLTCIMSCEYDTLRRLDWIENRFVDRSGIEVVKTRYGEEKEVCVRYYDRSKNLIKGVDGCSQFIIRYDLIDRVVYKKHYNTCNYGWYAEKYVFKGNKEFLYETNRMGSKLYSIKEFQDQNTYKQTTFHNDSSVTITKYIRSEKPIEKQILKNSLVVEKWDWEYLQEGNKEIAIVRKNGNEDYRIETIRTLLKGR
jgi:hypothetical protein